mmetsp:Transcript_2584/g.7039  ORF Transcript_2584/g.7039 Transcript_2584/m.7039 type:complete len:173 (-) Transcript_2584:206-724(-)
MAERGRAFERFVRCHIRAFAALNPAHDRLIAYADFVAHAGDSGDYCPELEPAIVDEVPKEEVPEFTLANLSRDEAQTSNGSSSKPSFEHSDRSNCAYVKLPRARGLQKLVARQGTSQNCNICGKHFDRRSNLIKHIRSVHEDERLYRCKKCTKTFRQKSSVVKHLSDVHACH